MTAAYKRHRASQSFSRLRKPVNTKGWGRLMRALANEKPENLDGDFLISMSALFFRLAADRYSEER